MRLPTHDHPALTGRWNQLTALTPKNSGLELCAVVSMTGSYLGKALEELQAVILVLNVKKYTMRQNKCLGASILRDTQPLSVRK